MIRKTALALAAIAALGAAALTATPAAAKGGKGGGGFHHGHFVRVLGADARFVRAGVRTVRNPARMQGD